MQHFVSTEIVCTVVVDAVIPGLMQNFKEALWRRKVKELNGHLCFVGRMSQPAFMAMQGDIAEKRGLVLQSI